MEDTKETYYEVLQKSSAGWHQRQHRLSSWFEYHVALLLAAYKEFEERVTVVAGRGEKTAWVLEMVEQLPDEFQIGDVVRLCPGVSRPMVRHILEALREKKKLMVIGIGRGARWKKQKEKH